MTKAGAAARPWQGRGHRGGSTEGGAGAPGALDASERPRPRGKRALGRGAGPAPGLKCRGVAAKKRGDVRPHSGFAGSGGQWAGVPPEPGAGSSSPCLSHPRPMGGDNSRDEGARISGEAAGGRRRRLSRARERGPCGARRAGDHLTPAAAAAGASGGRAGRCCCCRGSSAAA